MITNNSKNILFPLIEQDDSYYVLDLSLKWPYLLFGVFYNLFATVPVYNVNLEVLNTNDYDKKENRKQGNIVVYAVIGSFLGKTISKVNAGISPVLCAFIFIFIHLFLAYKNKKKPLKFNELVLTHYRAKYEFNNCSYGKMIITFLSLLAIWIFQNGLFLLTGYLFFTSEIENNLSYFIMHCIWIYILYLPTIFNPTSGVGKYVINKS